jgi:hypothetical protein
MPEGPASCNCSNPQAIGCGCPCPAAAGQSTSLHVPRYTAPRSVTAVHRGMGAVWRGWFCTWYVTLLLSRSHTAYTYQIRTSSCETGSKGARQEAWGWLFLLLSPAQSWAGPAREPAYSQLPARPSVHIKRSSPLSCILCTLRLLFLDLRV